MRHLMIVLSLMICTVPYTKAQRPIAIAIHGGAGTIEKKQMSAAKERAIRATLKKAVDAGYRILQNKGSAIDAVTAAIVILEDSPLFNAGRGAVYTADGTHTLDASIMSGADLSAGAVAGVTTVKNPILAARAVMTHSPHVLLAGKGADDFARHMGLTIVDNHYFDTEFRHQQWLNAKRKQKLGLSPTIRDKVGTVGAVALDANGHLAAGTSTGGMTNKAWGRVGDSPLIGAGTYAQDPFCAISATGHGEYFIRYAVAYDICARVKYQGSTLQHAAEAVIQDTLRKAGGDGGIIGLDASGNIVFSFNTPGMYRGWRSTNDSSAHAAIYAGERGPRNTIKEKRHD